MPFGNNERVTFGDGKTIEKRPSELALQSDAARFQAAEGTTMLVH